MTTAGTGRNIPEVDLSVWVTVEKDWSLKTEGRYRAEQSGTGRRHEFVNDLTGTLTPCDSQQKLENATEKQL